MEDTTPMTKEEGKRLRSLMESGRLHVFRQGDHPVESLPDQDVKNNVRSRVLAKSPKPKPTTRAAQKPKQQQRTGNSPTTKPRQAVDDE
jgi:hypothetical protein